MNKSYILKERKCKECGEAYIPTRQAQPRCKICVFKIQKEKYCNYQRKNLVNRTKKPQKPLKEKIDEEQVKINKIVRERDANKPCISCGKKMKPHEIQAGHYYARSQCESLRYDLDNIHGQCSWCNSKMTEDKTVPANYRKNLLERIGTEGVERLDLKRKNAGRISISVLERL